MLQDKVGRKVVKKCPLFVNVHRKCQRRGRLSKKKSQNLVNVICEQPLIDNDYLPG